MLSLSDVRDLPVPAARGVGSVLGCQVGVCSMRIGRNRHNPALPHSMQYLKRENIKSTKNNGTYSITVFKGRDFNTI